MVLIRTHWPILLILVIGSILRFYNLGLIPGPVFDEVFYPAFALNYLKGETFLSVHPPLGSYLFTLSVYFYELLPWTDNINFSLANVESIDPISYRWISAVSGVSLIFVGYKLALELLSRNGFALLVALFLALDGSLLVDSRLGLINIFFTLFGFMAILFFIKGLKRDSMGLLFLSGLLLGSAISIKWNGLGFWLTLLAFMLLLFALNKISLHSEENYKNSNLKQASLVFVLPFLVYLVFWLPDLSHNGNTLIDQHSQMIAYHFDETDQKPHPYSSPWYTWPMMIRPIAYFFDSGTIINLDGTSTEIFTAIHLLPNPALNFLSLVAVILLTFKWIEVISKSVSGKKVMEETYLISFILIGFYSNFIPWAVASRSTFIYHYQPAACFSFMALAFLLYRLTTKNKRENYFLYYVSLILILISAVYWLPLQLGLEITSESFYSRMWFDTWI